MHLLGPFALASGVQPQQLTDCLNYLAQRFKLDILKPEPEIIDGSFKTIGDRRCHMSDAVLLEQKGW